jgi:hypothetical protein
LGIREEVIMNPSVWDHVRKAAAILAAAKTSQNPFTRANLQQAAYDLLDQPASLREASGPSWGEVLSAHRR